MHKFDQEKMLAFHLDTNTPIKVRQLCKGQMDTLAGAKRLKGNYSKNVTDFLNDFMKEEPEGIVLTQDNGKGSFFCSVKDFKEIILGKFLATEDSVPNQLVLKSL